ncbi:MAG: MFS transporter, partial [Clostridium perfringens]|nr:MFS transporter [Clostridium perfringens]
ITYVAIFMETKYLGKNFTGLFSDLVAIQYSNVLLVLAVISLVALVLYWTLIGRREKKDI